VSVSKVRRRPKTTYYLRTLGGATNEKATVQAAAETPEVSAIDAAACSIEAAARGEECEACQ
jgi:hypothetical protein